MRIKAFVGIAVIGCLAVGLGACGSSGSGTTTATGAGGGSQSLKGHHAVFTIFEPGLTKPFTEAFLTPVGQRTGLTYSVQSPTDYVKLQTQVQSGNVSWTVLEADPWWAIANCGKLIDRVSVTVPNLPSKYELSGCDVPGNTWTFNIAYDSKKFASDPPTTWKDFFNTTKYPGKRAVWGSYVVNGILEGALLADGVSPDHLYPLDLNRAFKKLDTIKSDITFYDSLAQSTEIMQSHNAAMVLSTNNAERQAAVAGAPYKPIWRQSLLSYDSYIVPKGGDTAAADAILKQIASVEGQTTLATKTTFGPTNPAVKVSLPPTEALWSPAGHNGTLTLPLDQRYWAKNYESVAAQYQKWVSG